jgi:hypothetical protein
MTKQQPRQQLHRPGELQRGAAVSKAGALIAGAGSHFRSPDQSLLRAVRITVQGY